MESLKQYKNFLDRNIDGPIEDAFMASGGRNSKVFVITAACKQKYVLKDYYCDRSDKRKRLLNESGAFEFLILNGLKNIPDIIDLDETNNFGLYEYVDGVNFSNTIVKHDDIDEAIRFIQDLKRLSKNNEAKKFGRASEACFSFKELIANLRLRINRLKQVPECCEINKKMHVFIDSAVIPFLERLIAFNNANFISRPLKSTESLDTRNRILSPSDFGFHNAIKKADNRIVFIDFEYFGWDDPAKFLSDFLLHPNMTLSNQLKMYFKQKFEALMVEDREFGDRFTAYFPFFGIKWCLIILNEFIRADLDRRLFATKAEIDTSGIKKRQYNLSIKLFHEVKKSHEQKGFIN